ncbi:ACT domain-containing protein [Cohnella sp. CFH 77786]|uniref:aromatic acid exporter family protein n=1 Tax=Cohnella sp. CFH 77786 TaxID=2662265 RepID=UPI001C60A6E0|nr:aromatic acid exporter family protein [Cohnella sp. CFH 77786]MBW5447546.1 ACT domain-containing protein [Cohnella sp. CFH 77786]
MVGARVLKTCLAVMVSVLIANSLHLHAYQFAGIIAVLSVQPSLHRSLKNGIRQLASAVMGALIGSVALFAAGDSFLTMGIVTFLLMGLHVRIGWTNSLLVSVVIAINTMGAPGLPFWESALNPIALVLIGTGMGTLINLVHKPVHQERAEVLLTQSEGMLRALLYYMLLDLENGRVTSYVSIKEQIDEINGYLKKGKEISGLVTEDRKYLKTAYKNTSNIFQAFESMLARIDDMAKVLTLTDPSEEEIAFTAKALKLLIRLQEQIVSGKKPNLASYKRALERKRALMWNGSGESEGFYNLYGIMIDYAREMERFLVENAGMVKRQLSYTSIDRPGLIAEISDILGRHGFNITGVSIRVNGEFATTTMEVAARDEAGQEDAVRDIRKVRHVLTAKLR